MTGAIVESDFHFEGAEKLLEVWFVTSEQQSSGSLRSIPRDKLDILLELAKCQIISVISNENMDAYLLSESSLFISDSRIILKTCGTTHLLATFGFLIELAKEYAGLTEILNVFYSRKNFSRPDLQPHRHKNFDAEMEHLDEFFSDGAAYCMGRLNQDRWYLYTLNPSRGQMLFEDQTLEILMSDLDPLVMDIFTKHKCSSGREATQLAGIDKLVPPDTIIDDKLFEPCGYSMNGILKKTEEYVTIHVTPEANFSYVSYETNIDQADMFEQACGVLECFKPKRFLMTLFANSVSTQGQKGQQTLYDRIIPNYKRKDLQFLTLPEYTLVYAHFEFSSKSA